MLRCSLFTCWPVYADNVSRQSLRRWPVYADYEVAGICRSLTHAAFLHQNRRYAACFACTTGDAFAKAVAKAGYATDPNYAAKLISIIGQHQLADLDGGS